MIHGESIACPAVLTGTWPAALAARHGTGCLLAKVGQPMGGSQERAARSPACHSLQTASDLFTSPCVCVCVSEKTIGMAMIIILIMPSAHTLAKVQLSIPD